MKRLSIFAAAVLLSGTTAVMAVPNPNSGVTNQSQGTGNQQSIDSRVAAIFSTYKNGGPEMTAELTALLTTNPELAADVAAASKKTNNNNQKIASGMALAQAEQALRDAGNSTAANRVKGAASASDESTQAAYQSATSQASAADAGEGGGQGSRGGFGNGGNYGGGSGGGSVSAH